jgi:hypothetical protein
MSGHAIPPLVLTFLSEHVSNLEQFQLLVRVVQDADRWWDAALVTRELGFGATEAQGALDHLAKHNLLDIRITGDLRYRFRPGTDELRVAAMASVDEFRRKPVEMLEHITSLSRRRIRDFADAFRIRRDDDR